MTKIYVIIKKREESKQKLYNDAVKIESKTQ